ncbi:MAG: nickel pincer cofactor biosynthesis protein LarB [Phascolarctobacterium sp.]|nr:nickel pincer cofactor biosynthesis protein LarB [Phascolarctobacterium sp.]
MDEKFLKLLTAYKKEELSTAELLERIMEIHGDLGFAKPDFDREKRQGFAEAIYCEGKTPVQNAEIMLALSKRSANVIATRADTATFEAIRGKLPGVKYYEAARIVALERNPLPKDEKRVITIVTAGTSDIPVAKEASVTASIMGNKVNTIYDVGVAGIHRLLDRMDAIRSANVLIVVAGMEGALASVIAGQVDRPVIAVPTSVGYGANFQGLSALLGMLNSCSGVAVMNIDNGFGAGRMASIINHMR